MSAVSRRAFLAGSAAAVAAPAIAASAIDPDFDAAARRVARDPIEASGSGGE